MNSARLPIAYDGAACRATVAQAIDYVMRIESDWYGQTHILCASESVDGSLPVIRVHTRHNCGRLHWVVWCESNGQIYGEC